MIVAPIVILGSPRSGTSWIGKIFDSHPDVLYRHEPDRIDRGGKIPHILDASAVSAELQRGREWLDRLVRLRAFEANTIPPFFSKRWAGRNDWSRRIMQHATRWVGTGLYRAGLRPPFLVHDQVDLDRVGKLVPVIKSVSGLGRARLFHDAGARTVVVILRHPGAVVASILRGVATGRMRDEFFPGPLSTTIPARRRGLTAAMLDDLDSTVRHATSWALYNDHALELLSGAERVTVVSYDAFARDPVTGAKTLFAAVGLEWDPQTENFLKSLAGFDRNAPYSYFDIRRAPLEQIDRWRQELTPEQITNVELCVRESLAYRTLWSCNPMRSHWSCEC